MSKESGITQSGKTPGSKLPGPRGRIITTWRFMKDPYLSYRNWQRKYGNTFLVKALNGDVIATCEPELIKKIYALPHEAIGTFAPQTTKPLVGEESVILVEGKQHRRDRAMLMPHFRGEEIQRHLPAIETIAHRVGIGWEAGQTIRMMDASLELSLEVIIRIVFGVEDSSKISGYLQSIREFVSSFHPSLAFTRRLHRPWLGLSPWNRFKKARNHFFGLLDEEIDRRKSNQEFGDDILSRLLQTRYEDGSELSQANIRDQLVTMLLAGHETTQIALSWAMSWIHRSPTVLDELRSEIGNQELNEAIENPLLEAVCLEALRLNPIVADIIRVLKQPLESERFHFETGSAMAVSIYLVHMDESIYENAAAFIPHRWLKQSRRPTEYMPFGGGVRRCLGATLAMLELKAALAAWIREFEFELPDNVPDREPVIRRNITMAPKSGIPLVLKRRLSA